MFATDIWNRKFDNKKVDIMNKMVTELSLYMTDTELDQCMDFMYQIEDSKFDINPTVSDCKTQLKLILGSDRYEQIVEQWKQNNQKLLSVFGTLKYKNKKDTNDKTLYDGLDPTDDPKDWEKVYV
jgi:uncharacterized protein YpuA (DUF1002 family)